MDVISMRPHHDYVIVGRRAALQRGFAVMLDDLHAALRRLERQAGNRPAQRQTFPKPAERNDET
jgi:ribonuclease P protein component